MLALLPVLLLVLPTSALVTGQTAALPEDAEPPRPNVVFIFADDMGYGEVHALNPERCKVPTPHLDGLAGEGMTFTDAHTTSSVCTPSRYSLLTGRYAWRTRLQKGVMTGDSPPLIAEDRVTLGGLFQSQGYRTAILGKWHLGYGYEPATGPEGAVASVKTKTLLPAAFPIGSKIVGGPLTRGFDDFYGFHHAREMSSMVEGDVITEELQVVEILPAITERAVDYIQSHAAEARAGKPFFLYLPLSSPHSPIVPSKGWRGRSGIGAYGDFVAQTDGVIGDVLAALEASGLQDNTLVVFSADNGTSRIAGLKKLAEKGHFPSGPYRGSKADLWDGGHRVPLFVRWPGRVEAGSTATQLTSLSDVLATAADLLDVPLPAKAGEDSISFLPVLLDQAAVAPRTTVVHHSIHGHFAIRRGPWKLLLAPGSGGWSAPQDAAARKAGLPDRQLYHMGNDPAERENLLAEHPERASELLKVLQSLVKRGRSTAGEAGSNDAQVDLWKAGK
ncbi:MAG: arylsulfatase A-like enzyme [Planctomycetota bacterium]|jgi:arylsulfatase A-like enzyme